MKKALLILSFAILSIATYAQTTFKEYKAGHVFTVSLPDYMTRTIGLNSAAAIQFKNLVKDIAGLIIEDNKEELKMAEMSFANLSEYYEDFEKDFLKDQPKRKVSKAKTQKIGDVTIVTSDASYYDEELKTDIYYFIGMIETKDAFYKVLCWGGQEVKDKYKADFEKLTASIKD